jgi:hypothetical protein
MLANTFVLTVSCKFPSPQQSTISSAIPTLPSEEADVAAEGAEVIAVIKTETEESEKMNEENDLDVDSSAVAEI